MTTANLPRTITTNVTRATFNHVKNNPGIPRVDLITQLETMGQIRASVAAMVSQLLRNGNIEYIGNGLFATQDEYAPLQATAPRPTRVFRGKAPKPKAPVVHSAGLPDILSVSVHDPVPAPAVKSYATPAEWTVESVVGNLSVRQALAVYMELKQIFGG